MKIALLSLLLSAFANAQAGKYQIVINSNNGEASNPTLLDTSTGKMWTRYCALTSPPSSELRKLHEACAVYMWIEENVVGLNIKASEFSKKLNEIYENQKKNQPKNKKEEPKNNEDEE